jgi:putative transcriptional regulator
MIELPDSGDLLIAPPGIPDSRFKHAVLLLTHDHLGGSFALCVNRSTDHVLQEAIRDVEGLEDADLRFPLYWGGPVSPGTIWMLHSSEWDSEHTVSINDEWSMTSHVSMFYALADGDFPNQFRLLVGYCSWAQGQLRAELRGLPPWSHNHSWLVAQDPGPEWVFETPIEQLWNDATELSSQQAVNSWL